MRRRNTVDTTVHQEEVVGQMCPFLLAYGFPVDEYSIVVIGDTGVGKTTWATARAPKPALLVSHMDQLKNFRPSYHKSIIFDDMSFQHLPTTGQIHLVDYHQPRAIHIRYGTVTLPKETVKIFTCNELPFTDHPAIRRRIHIINAY